MTLRITSIAFVLILCVSFFLGESTNSGSSQPEQSYLFGVECTLFGPDEILLDSFRPGNIFVKNTGNISERVNVTLWREDNDNTA